METLNEYAVTVKDQGTVFMMSRVKKWLEDTEQLRVVIGALEDAPKSGKHWQLVIKTIWGIAHTRDKIKAAFPELVGKRGSKGNKYSVGELYTPFDNNIGYCLKGYKDVDGEDNEDMCIFKGVERQAVIQLGKDYNEAVEERRSSGQSKKASWNDILYANVEETGAETNEEIGRAVLAVYHRKRKTFPNKYQLSQIMFTMRSLKYQEGTDELDNHFDELISQAMSV